MQDLKAADGHTVVDFWWDVEGRTTVHEDYHKLIRSIRRRKPTSLPPTLIVAGDFDLFQGSALKKSVVVVGNIPAKPLADASDEELASPSSVINKWSQHSEYKITLEERARIPIGKHVINDTHFRCDKPNVLKHFAEVAGYTSSVDPNSFSGVAVSKSSRHAHDGRIVRLPQSGVDDNLVYERLLDNSIGHNLVFDIRLGVLLGIATHAYIKFRHRHHRFANINIKAFLFSPSELLSSEEIDLCLRFCDRIGLEYGELDIIRDRGSNRIYIIDTNNTPAGPPKALKLDQQYAAREMIWQAFRRSAFKGII